MLSRIKKNDTVVVLSGKDKTKQGVVLSVDPKKSTLIAKDLGVVTRHVKAKKAGEKGKIVQEERPIALCKVMPVCPACKKPCRIKVKFVEEGQKKVRSCHRCREEF
ncbi:MAG: 50S ribosomal protein L24 [Epsilonproteobacteria bacterium]|nr:50S ribosomal protein L24 [Campylobacterota bacterium]